MTFLGGVPKQNTFTSPARSALAIRSSSSAQCRGSCVTRASFIEGHIDFPRTVADERQQLADCRQRRTDELLLRRPQLASTRTVRARTMGVCVPTPVDQVVRLTPANLGPMTGSTTQRSGLSPRSVISNVSPDFRSTLQGFWGAFLTGVLATPIGGVNCSARPFQRIDTLAVESPDTRIPSASATMCFSSHRASTARAACTPVSDRPMKSKRGRSIDLGPSNKMPEPTSEQAGTAR